MVPGSVDNKEPPRERRRPIGVVVEREGLGLALAEVFRPFTASAIDELGQWLEPKANSATLMVRGRGDLVKRPMLAVSYWPMSVLADSLQVAFDEPSTRIYRLVQGTVWAPNRRFYSLLLDG